MAAFDFLDGDLDDSTFFSSLLPDLVFLDFFYEGLISSIASLLDSLNLLSGDFELVSLDCF